MTEVQNRRSRHGRSPSYPTVGLRVSCDRAQAIWDRERQHEFPVETLPAMWGYKSLNGPAGLTLASLIKFGLATDEGTGSDRRAQLTNLAVDILLNPNPEERERAVKKAALTPPIHAELWSVYGASLPSDTSLYWILQRDRGFTESGAREFVREYRDTIEFAKLAMEDAFGTPISTSDDDLVRSTLPDNGGEVASAPQAPNRLGGLGADQRPVAESLRPLASSEYAIPLFGGDRVVIIGDFPIGERDWDQFMAVLAAMKPGLVKQKTEELFVIREDKE